MRPRSFLRCVCLTAIALAIGTFDVQHTLIAADEVPVPAYEELLVAGMYPAGGQRGTSVTVEVWGASSARKGRELKGMDGARTLIIDGPPGITVRDVKNLSGSRMQATLDIAADAAPGRRMVRVQSDRVGATSGTWFVVGELPEVLESKRNNEPAEAMKVTAPVTVNGSIEETLDTDCFRFAAKAGQKIVAAVVAHAIDRHSRGRNTQGFIDVSLELLGPDGALVADAQDTVGLDPVIEYTAERDGDYTARVFLVGYLGCPEAVYRLALGETQFATALDPPGGQRGQTVSLNFTGPGVPADAKFSFQVPDDPRPVIWITPPGSASDVPFVLGNFPEMNEQEPNSELKSANPLKPGYTTNGRFNEAGDEDWYVIELAAKQRIKLDLVAQRYLREPVDTLLEVLDEKGVKVAGNDDLAVTDVEVLHDFDPFDSALSFDPPSAGKFYIKVSEQSGASGHRGTTKSSGRDVDRL